MLLNMLFYVHVVCFALILLMVCAVIFAGYVALEIACILTFLC